MKPDIFYQHIAEWGRRDLPKTVGAHQHGLISFTWSDVEGAVERCAPEQSRKISENFAACDTTSIQIWGIPSGAISQYRRMAFKDTILLAPKVGNGGSFVYGGRILFKFGIENFELSRFFWGSQNFPLIFACSGMLIDYPWCQFLNDAGYDPGYGTRGLQGRIVRIGDAQWTKTAFTRSDFFERVKHFVI